jgi:NAD(P)-dependent dehydrogenase (short-subunit alcohol dehydrogenase family)
VQAALKLPLDVAQQESVDRAIARALEQFGRIDVLVNNAGYAVRGALEEVPDEQVRQMFEVNVFGALRMIRAVAPIMRKQRAGRIVNISSIAGRVSTPVNGSYSASKFALEALSDALRVELAPFGVRVIAIEPGAIRTNFNETADSYARGILSNESSAYQPLYRKSGEFSRSMSREAPGPEIVSKVIQQAIESPNPKPRYLAGMAFSGRLVMCLRDLLWDLALKQLFSVRI